VDRNRNATKSPRSALQPVQPNLSIKQQPSEKQYKASSQATLDQNAASHSNRHLPIASLPQMSSAEEKAFFFRKTMLEAEKVKSPPPNAHNTIEIQDFSANAYFSSIKQNIENGYEKENTSVERHAPSVKKLVGVTGGRAERQAHMLIAQTDTNSTLKTWISCTDEEAGLTFTQSLCGDTVFDIALPTASTETVSTPRNKDAISLAPAPIESSSTTSSRVAALTGEIVLPTILILKYWSTWKRTLITCPIFPFMFVPFKFEGRYPAKTPSALLFQKYAGLQKSRRLISFD
jgi:hypothetical protein